MTAAQVGDGTVSGVRSFLTPGWLALHAAVLVLAVGSILLGWWQWNGGYQGRDIQTIGYAFQWWIFCLFGVAFWIRLMRDARRRLAQEIAADPTAAPRARIRPSPSSDPRAASTEPAIPAAPPVAGPMMYRPPAPPAAVTDDSELGRYNAYLAQLKSDQAGPSDASSPAAEEKQMNEAGA